MTQNGGWSGCPVEGCKELQLRLSGLCLKHDTEAPYKDFYSYLEERLKDPVFKKFYEEEYAKILKSLDISLDMNAEFKYT